MNKLTGQQVRGSGAGEMEKGNIRVCVTGGSGYIGSWLVKKLLQKGYTVHATLRNLEDKSKVGLLKSLPNADSNLVLFKADLYNSNEYEAAIKGCDFVFHVATPMVHDHTSTQFKDMVEATIAAVKSMADSCIRSQTVKRLIYTATVMACSPMNENGIGVKPCLDESCWTPLDLSFTYCDNFTLQYTKEKTLAEKEVLSYNEIDGAKVELVTLNLSLVGGETILPYLPYSVEVILSLLTGNQSGPYQELRFLQELLGSVPLSHVDDVCDAHIFCMERPSMKGRFIVAAANPTVWEIAGYFKENGLEIKMDEIFMEKPSGKVACDSSKLTNMGFVYKYDLKKILDHSVESAKRLGVLPVD